MQSYTQWSHYIAILSFCLSVRNIMALCQNVSAQFQHTEHTVVIFFHIDCDRLLHTPTLATTCYNHTVEFVYPRSWSLHLYNIRCSFHIVSTGAWIMISFQYLAFLSCVRGYRGGSPTAVQAWQPCPLWELSPSHPILL